MMNFAEEPDQDTDPEYGFGEGVIIGLGYRNIVTDIASLSQDDEIYDCWLNIFEHMESSKQQKAALYYSRIKDISPIQAIFYAYCISESVMKGMLSGWPEDEVLLIAVDDATDIEEAE